MFFMVCRICGLAPLAVSEIEGEQYAVINIAGGCTPHLDTSGATVMDYDDETLSTRLARRQATWIKRVHLPPAGD